MTTYFSSNISSKSTEIVKEISIIKDINTYFKLNKNIYFLKILLLI